MPDTKHVQRQQRLKKYAEDIAILETRRDLAIERDEGEAFIRRLEKKIAHRKQRLRDGWPEE